MGMNYVSRVMKRYADQNRMEELNQIQVLIIYTADVTWAMEEYDLGGVKIKIEAAYLVNRDSEEICQKLERRITSGKSLTEEEMAELMILPLTVPGTAEKQAYIEKAIKLAKQISDRMQSNQALAGILTFCDKVIEKEYAEKVKEEMQMTLVEQLIYADGVAEGRVEGRAEGYQALIQDNLEEGIGKDRIIEKLMKQFSMTSEKAQECFDKYSCAAESTLL